MVASATDVQSGMEMGAALADENVAGRDFFTAEPFHAEPLRLRVASVAGTTACFFMCHSILSSFDPGDLDPGIVLPVPGLAAVVLAALEFDDADLVAPAVLEHCCGDGGPFDNGGADFDGITIAQHQDFGKFDFVTRRGINALDVELVALADPVLLAAGFNNVVHKILSIARRRGVRERAILRNSPALHKASRVPAGFVPAP